MYVFVYFAYQIKDTFRKFNPNLKGYGTDIGRWDSKEAGMNVGYPGDKAK